jgi:hypothetical protein
MRSQFRHRPQKSGSPSDSAGLRQFIVRASISASVYFPAPRGPARSNACGKWPVRTLSRSRVTVATFPRNSRKLTVRVYQPGVHQPWLRLLKGLPATYSGIVRIHLNL